LLAKTNDYTGAVPADQTYGTAIPDNRGIALLNAADEVIDAVGFDAGTTYKEGLALPPLTGTADQAYRRKALVCGEDLDTEDNAQDFELITPADPRNQTSCRPACAGDLCTPPVPVCVDATALNVFASVCDAGVCVATPTPQSCEFGCAAGACLTDPCASVTCTTPPNDVCYATEGSCVAGHCEYLPRGVTVTCDDGNSCSVDDHCDGNGSCVGAAKTCNQPPTTCHQAAGVCAAGVCGYTLKEVGSPCDDNDECTSDDRCNINGECVPGTTVKDCGQNTNTSGVQTADGCNCRAQGSNTGALFVVLGLFSLAWRRRR